jgi:hypothetical protein
LALVVVKLSFDNNPRLQNGRGFFILPATVSHNQRNEAGLLDGWMNGWMENAHGRAH